MNDPEFDLLLRKIHQENADRPRLDGWYSPEGDCVFYYTEDGPHSRDRIDDLLTVYRAEEDGRIIGLQIKGISRLPEHDVMALGFGQDREIELVCLILLTFKSQESPRDLAKEYIDICGQFVGKRISGRELVRTAVS